MPRSKKIIFIICIVALSLALRLINLNAIEVNTDEGNYALRGIGWNDFMMSTVLATPWLWYSQQEQLPFWTMLSFFDHPPLHFAGIWLSTHIFGISLWSVRLPAVIFGVASVLLIILILQRFKMEKGALLAGLFLAVMPWHIFISQQAIQESGVIFWMLLTIYFFSHNFNKKMPVAPEDESIAEEPRAIWWILSGLAFGAAILTKYSAILILPAIFYYFLKYKWYKKINFWLFPATFIISLLPIIIYNFKTYLLRGHFDMQLARLIGQKSDDWLSSQQGIWEGSLKSFFAFFYDLSQWISLPAALLILAGLFFILKKRESLGEKPIFLTYGMIAITGLLSTITLSDYGRSAIIIPFIVLGVGFVANIKSRILNYIFIVMILLSMTVSIADKFSVQIIPPKIATSFIRQNQGYEVWDKWLAENQPAVERPRHYSSMSEWVLNQAKQINESDKPIIIYDKRMSWFPANWYFFRHSFYTTNYPVIHASFFAYLLKEGLINMNSQKIYYVQVTDISQDTKPEFDDLSKITDEILFHLAEKQQPEPIILKNVKDENLLVIWPLQWDANFRLEFD